MKKRNYLSSFISERVKGIRRKRQSKSHTLKDGDQKVRDINLIQESAKQLLNMDGIL